MAGQLGPHTHSSRSGSSHSCGGSTTSDASSLYAITPQTAAPRPFHLDIMVQLGGTFEKDVARHSGGPQTAGPGHGTTMCSVPAACDVMTASRAGSSLCGTLSGISEAGTFVMSDASLPPSGRTTPRQVLPQPPPACTPPVALPAPSGRGAMLVDASSGRLEWVQPSGPRKAGEGTEPEQQGIIGFCMLPQGGALMSITLLASGFLIGPAGCSVRELARATGADVKSWSDAFPTAAGCAARPARTFLLQGPPAAVMAAVEVAAAAVLRYKYLCEGACFGQQVSRTQVVRGITFVYLPPPRRKVPYAAAIASAPLPRSDTSAPPRYTPAPLLSRPQTRLSAAAPAWPAPLQQPTPRQAIPKRVLPQQQAALQHQQQLAVPQLCLQPLPGSIWSSSAVNSTAGWSNTGNAL